MQPQQTDEKTTRLSLRENPVFRREARSRLRHIQRSLNFNKALFALLGAIIGVCYLYLAVQFNHRLLRHEDGLVVWTILGHLQLGLILLLTPGLVASAITLEREQRTLEMLLLTHLQPSEIVSGKLFARLLLPGGLLVGFLPLALLCATHGGVTGVNFVFTYVLLLVVALAMGSVAMLCSALFRRTAVATAVAYSVLIFLVLGVLFLEVITTEEILHNYGEGPTVSFVTCPFLALQALFFAEAPSKNYGFGDQNALWPLGIVFYGLLAATCLAVLIRGFDARLRS